MPISKASSINDDGEKIEIESLTPALNVFICMNKKIWPICIFFVLDQPSHFLSSNLYAEKPH